MSKYTPLRDHLSSLKLETVVIEFCAIEKILGDALPASARRHRAWWANEKVGSHTQSVAWLDAGFGVDSVDFGRSRVTFKKL